MNLFNKNSSAVIRRRATIHSVKGITSLVIVEVKFNMKIMVN